MSGGYNGRKRRIGEGDVNKEKVDGGWSENGNGEGIVVESEVGEGEVESSGSLC